MLRPMQKFVVTKPWNEIVVELLKEGYQLSEIRQDGAILRPNKPLIDRIAHAKEN
jgi:hypothetical protein